LADKKEIDRIIERLQKLELNDIIAKEYLNEAIVCIQNDCHRSAILMTWSVMMFVLYKEIEGWGLQEFARRLASRKKIKPILTMYDLN
jgi:hypothetical protein